LGPPRFRRQVRIQELHPVDFSLATLIIEEKRHDDAYTLAVRAKIDALCAEIENAETVLA
jgi:hypothetical protein